MNVYQNTSKKFLYSSYFQFRSIYGYQDAMNDEIFDILIQNKLFWCNYVLSIIFYFNS